MYNRCDKENKIQGAIPKRNVTIHKKNKNKIVNKCISTKFFQYAVMTAFTIYVSIASMLDLFIIQLLILIITFLLIRFPEIEISSKKRILFCSQFDAV